MSPLGRMDASPGRCRFGTVCRDSQEDHGPAPRSDLDPWHYEDLKMGLMDIHWFRQALNQVNATQADLARHLRLAPSAVSRMMRGRRQIKQLETVQIARFLSVSPAEVLRHAVRDTISPPRGEVIAQTLDRLVDEAGRDERSSFAALVRAARLDPARDFIGAFLAGLDFRDEDLRGFNFSGADLTGAD